TSISLRSGCLVDVIAVVLIQWFFDFKRRVFGFPFFVTSLLFGAAYQETHYGTDEKHSAQHREFGNRSGAKYPEIDLVHVFHKDNRDQHGQYNNENGFCAHGLFSDFAPKVTKTL